jgi:hypothetical protein
MLRARGFRFVTTIFELFCGDLGLRNEKSEPGTGIFLSGTGKLRFETGTMGF